MSDTKGKKRASTSSKNRSPSPFRSHAGLSMVDFVNEFWQHTINIAENVDDDFKHQALPLARIKKVMKSDPEVKMISSEVTLLFEKACQIFIQELTARSHMISLSGKRRTLSRPDVAAAIAKSDMFDFLIDIVPRDESWANAMNLPPPETAQASTSTSATTTGENAGFSIYDEYQNNGDYDAGIFGLQASTSEVNTSQFQPASVLGGFDHNSEFMKQNEHQNDGGTISEDREVSF